MKQWRVLNKVSLGNTRGKHGSSQEIVDVLLDNRGVKTTKEVEKFLNPKLESVTMQKVGIDLKEVEKTLERIKKAIKNNEAIVI
ncbi:MAG: hypothetical protein ACHQT7_00570, partial [Candidatus Levyibacteriota bacterium]